MYIPIFQHADLPYAVFQDTCKHAKKKKMNRMFLNVVFMLYHFGTHVKIFPLSSMYACVGICVHAIRVCVHACMQCGWSYRTLTGMEVNSVDGVDLMMMEFLAHGQNCNAT
jgi:hypothetical protein